MSTEPRDPPTGPFWAGFGVIFVCFFLSGATGLVYQVLWLRLLGLVFGHTVYAITAVLAAFMAGLALGSFVFARRLSRFPNLIRAYGWLEIGIGVYCAVLPALLWLASVVYLRAHGVLGLSYDAFSLFQFLLVFLLLLVPTTLMGGTLPVLSQALVTQDRGLGAKVGALYAVNTFGAVVGVVLAGYVLLPAIGNRLTIAVAATANILVGLLAFAYARRHPVAASTAAEPTPEAAATRARKGADRRPVGEHAADVAAGGDTTPLGVWVTVLALGVSGAVSLAYEVAWTRALALVIGSSTYAFTSMLVAFLVGIAGGSALYSWLWGRRAASPATFAVIQLAIGVTVTVTMMTFERIPELFLVALHWSDSPSFVQLTQFVVSAVALLPFTLLIGATFPCAVAVAARAARRVGRDVGQIYAVNTLGAIAGTMLAGFVLIPVLGAQGTVKVGIAGNFITAAVLLAVSGPRLGVWPRVRPWQWAGLGGAVVAAIAVFFAPGWDPSVMSSGPAVYGKGYLQTSQRSMQEVLRSNRVVFYRDGISGTVAVTQEGDHVFLRVNGKMDAGTAVDMPTQLMSGHIPMLLHKDPRSVLVIGMGSGITAGAVSRYPVQRLDIAEIEPAVAEASRFFAHIHGDVLKDPRTHVVFADGRNYLLTTPQRYDVIISEPSNPWIGGLASLFSVELFTIARDRLRPGGMMLQWIQGYSIGPDDLRMVMNTFRSVFPSVTVWNTIKGDFLLVGRMEPTPVDLDRLRARYEENPGVWRDLERIGVMTWSSVLGYFMLGDADTGRLVAGAGLNTDDRLPLEFSAPRSLYLDTAEPNWQMVQGFKSAPLPELTPESRRYLEDASVEAGIGAGYASRYVFSEALAHLQRARQLDPDFRPALIWSASVLLRVGQPEAALTLAQRVLVREPENAEALFLAGLAYEATHAREQALAAFRQAVALQPRNRMYQAALQRIGAGLLR